MSRSRSVTEFRAVENAFDPDSTVSTDATWKLAPGFNKADNGGEALIKL